jgi:hypothetical protein
MYIIHDIELHCNTEADEDAKPTNEYMYIRYSHSPQVDFKKNEVDFQRAYNTLLQKYTKNK